ncbi:nucleoside deaminase [Terrimonas sp. NA20]|uniref:Nucleoside deaminase n=1 Tax=Terrimonas ginsenosidimutans TaxID=2908004 RepID=A0ABS9KZB8_9BACT|nr:nucleoside deaminase [Terrimonas ginsenosidimutans]MCG2617674.1 nucleoside deaminase [Terrimonas ginsenosidimutans]
MLTSDEKGFLERAIALSRQGMVEGNGGPFGCVIVKDNEVVGEGYNMVTSRNDPTAHAEVVAIRNACANLNTHQLTGCDVYTSCEPCPMCLGAIYWARPSRVIYANTREDAALIEFDDAFIYNEINALMEDRRIPFQHEPHPMAKEVFQQWGEWVGKKRY